MVEAGFEPVQFQNLNAMLTSSTNELLIPGLAPEHTQEPSSSCLESWKYELCQRVGMGQRANSAFFSFFSEERWWKNVAVQAPFWTFQGWFVLIIAFLESQLIPEKGHSVRKMWPSTCCPPFVAKHRLPRFPRCSLCPVSRVYFYGAWIRR